MVVILKQGVTKTQIEEFTNWIQQQAEVQVSAVYGAQTTILGLVGDTSAIDIDLVSSKDVVETVKRVQEPYKNANRKFHPDDTVVTVAGDRTCLLYTSGVERKTLERHRKYMVALLLIYTNGYEIIRGHLKQVMKGVAVR